MIKALIFDLGGVFLRPRSAEERQAIESQLDLPPGELGHRLFGGEAWKLARTGAITDDEYWQRVGPELGLTSPAQIRAFRQAYFASEKERLDTHLVSLARQLRERCQVALLSNASDRLEDILENKLGIADLFDQVINSARLGLAKPDPAIYELTLEHLGIAPYEAIFVDDRARNVIGASRLGIHVIHHVTFERTAAQIKALLEKAPTKAMIDTPVPEDYAAMLGISRAIVKEDWWSRVEMLAQPETTTDIAMLCDDTENIVLVARMSDQVAAMGLLTQPTPEVLHHTAELSLAVHPDHRRRGLGRRLIQTLLPAGARRGVELVRAWVASANGAARVLIVGTGFQEMTRLKAELQRPDGRRFDVIVYSTEIRFKSELQRGKL
jgi:putative hydrolase of the HAD superfamily